MSITDSGEYRNCPNEAAAVPKPKPIERHSGGNSLPKVATIIMNEVPDRPKPINAPAEMSSTGALAACDINPRPRANISPPAQNTRTGPKRSAITPASGWPTPHRRFCRASAKAKTSRLQLLAFDIGVRKKPSDDRGPNDNSEIRQPNPMITTGVRQPPTLATAPPDGDDVRRRAMVVMLVSATRAAKKGRAT